MIVARLVLPIVGLLFALADPVASALHPGDVLPSVSGRTLTGKTLDLPAAALGKPAIIVFSFSRAAGKDTPLWNDRVAKDFATSLAQFQVIELESAPRLVRGMAISGIKSAMPSDRQDRAVVLYRDEKLWKQRLAVSDLNRAYVILLGADGRIRWTNAGAFTDAEYSRLKNEIKVTETHP